MNLNTVWTSSSDESPPEFTLMANGVIELLNQFFLSVYWTESHADGPFVIIDVFSRHHQYYQFPGQGLGRVLCCPSDNKLVAVGRHREVSLWLDGALPDSFEQLSRFFKAARRHNKFRKSSSR